MKKNVPWTGDGKDPGPQAGIHDSAASQSQREAAFWHMAKSWGCERDFPRCDLLIIDGKQYACMTLLDNNYKPMEKALEADRNEPAKDLEPYRQRGDLHKWAVLDFVLGNADRHAANIMVNDRGDVKLIDHGSSFAGDHFDPAHDRDTFVPFYLRFVVPKSVNFNQLKAEEKLKYMQMAPKEAQGSLRRWLDGLEVGDLDQVLPAYGIDPGPEKRRLERLRRLASELGVDAAINSLWVLT